jgi:hypothetical protein
MPGTAAIQGERGARRFSACTDRAIPGVRTALPA